MSYKTIEVTEKPGVWIVCLNRPRKYNAYDMDMYTEIRDVLHSANDEPSVKALILTGKGKYFSSGNDLSNFLQVDVSNKQQMLEFAQQSGDMLYEFVDAFIRFKKILIGAVNGPAVGIGVSSLALFDLVYSVSDATFLTPFMALGQSPEACSSLRFYELMGPRATEMLVLGKKFSAQDALESNLVHKV
eukprot:TRINITY_DN5987_c0_g1_i2.p1 TRINITY_DN5987_c0_g1~~TRINITY_DN5987_c0_g1_i2.p1  ORF type:complete len:188 (+),score=32.42 TRINITY_DN5987_c0_g1_i2:45-608(+)